MLNKSPIFSIGESQHFNDDDYGFDTQIDCFQIFKESTKIKKHSHRKKWWKNALFFIKWKNTNAGDLNSGSFRRRRSVSGRITYGPVYITESRTGSSSTCRKTRRRFSGQLAGVMIPSKKSDLGMPYINLKEFNMDRISRISAAPIYLVT
ncbi:uncharacterized protein LOC107020014 [Solanum pennellii]|uniref:Uncharacterized protein LOC107020014 n=1 Tax=Solanum pennellii TaxID=28526 RepID=A0ABM1GTN6_SOLPN|nr:uncharacterized protein LOC107020014 [Solanum pennellii]